MRRVVLRAIGERSFATSWSHDARLLPGIVKGILPESSAAPSRPCHRPEGTSHPRPLLVTVARLVRGQPAGQTRPLPSGRKAGCLGPACDQCRIVARRVGALACRQNGGCPCPTCRRCARSIRSCPGAGWGGLHWSNSPGGAAPSDTGSTWPGPADIVTGDRLRDHRERPERQTRRGCGSQVRKSPRGSGP